MKNIGFVMLFLVFSITSAQAGSIYKCTQKNGQVIFTDKSCPNMNEEVIHEETEAEKKSRFLNDKVRKIAHLIQTGKTDLALAFAKEQDLENAYQQELIAYNQRVEQKLKQDVLEVKKQEQQLKKHQLLIQQQSVELQKKQLEQQQKQTEATNALAEKKRNRSSYYSPYGVPYNSYCRQYGLVKKCTQRPYNWLKPSTSYKNKSRFSVDINMGNFGKIKLEQQNTLKKYQYKNLNTSR